MMTVGELFAGIGGFGIGLERAGMTVKWQVENEPYCIKVLEKHWPSVTRYGDIRTVDWSTVEPVDLVCGGFPCQDLSVAGKQAGIDGERSGLWREYVRCIRALRPRYVLVENVPGLLANAAMGRVLGDLAACGYDAEWQIISAASVGARHLRKRVWIVAYPNEATIGTNAGQRTEYKQDDRPTLRPESDSGRQVMADAKGTGFTGSFMGSRQVELGRDYSRHREQPNGQWTIEPDVGRVAHGIPARVDRLKGLGNAVVPQIVEWLGRHILAHRQGEQLGTPARENRDSCQADQQPGSESR